MSSSRWSSCYVLCTWSHCRSSPQKWKGTGSHKQEALILLPHSYTRVKIQADICPPFATLPTTPGFPFHSDSVPLSFPARNPLLHVSRRALPRHGRGALCRALHPRGPRRGAAASGERPPLGALPPAPAAAAGAPPPRRRGPFRWRLGRRGAAGDLATARGRPCRARGRGGRREDRGR
jgi:hypothetical protein